MPRAKQEGSNFKEISISEFFEKNKHILGFDSPPKSLFMIVKEAIDNSLDACEEYGILPEINVEVLKESTEEFSITISDNGPGIERKEIPRVFGQLLYGSRFHSVRQSRGQQGIGITAAILYGQITTGKPSQIKSKRIGEDVAYEVILGINIKENKGNIFSEKPVIWENDHGTLITVHAKGRYQVGKQSILEYLKETAVVNPNMNLTFTDPDGHKHIFKRVLEIPSKPARAIKPHPLGLELGEIFDMSQNTESRTVNSFLTNDFNRISANVASQILEHTHVEAGKNPKSLTLEDIKEIDGAIKKVKLMPPPTDCLSPLGKEFIRRGLRNIYEDLQPEFYSKPIVRPVSVYSGNPFSVEVGMVFGGQLKGDEQIRIVRYGNKVPLLYQAGACSITKAVSEIDWRPYGLEQRQGNGIPYGPVILFVHVYGTRIPYTSESKEAIANVPEIIEEIKLALRGLGRHIRSHVNKKDRRNKAKEKFRLVRTLLPEISDKASQILGLERPDLNVVISKIANVVFVDEEIKKQEDSILVTVKVFNYTTEKRSLRLYADPPVGEISTGASEWEISEINPSSEVSYDFEITGNIASYPGTDYYFTGINEIYVQGADPLPGDWGMGDLPYEEETGEVEQ